MEFNVTPVAPVEPLQEQHGREMLPPAVNAEGSGDTEEIILMVQAIFSKAPPQGLENGRGVIRHRVNKQSLGGKGEKHLAVPLKGSDVGAKVDRQALQPMPIKGGSSQTFKAAREPVLAGSEGKSAFGVGGQKCASLGHKLGMKETESRVEQLFVRREGTQSHSKMPPAPVPLVPAGKERVQDARGSSRTEGMTEKEKVEEKERLGLERVRDREKVREELDQNAPKALSHEAYRIPPQHLDRIPPELFLGLGMLAQGVQQMVNSAEFRAARAVIIVQGIIEKAFLTHVLQVLGRGKQIYIWVLGTEDSYGGAWSLLRHVGMPFVTLVDLELGRQGGGWERVKLMLRRLLAVHGGSIGGITEDDISVLPYWDSSVEGMDPWLDLLESYGVFFALPLDLDFMLLQAFPKAYHSFPLRSVSSEVSWKLILHVAPHLLGGYTSAQVDLLPSYHKLFCLEQRLLVHQHAWRTLPPMELANAMPQAIHRLINRSLS